MRDEVKVREWVAVWWWRPEHSAPTKHCIHRGTMDGRDDVYSSAAACAEAMESRAADLLEAARRLREEAESGGHKS